jgi:large subunit ribosomal protein L25
MELAIFPRKSGCKGDIKKLRIQGSIPAIIYAKGLENENISVSAHDFNKILNEMQKGRLSTTVFTLKGEKEKFTAIVKEIQYDVTSYEVLHLDFEKLSAKEKVKVVIPIECIGAEACAGVKVGGLLRQTMRYLKVSCLPKEIPAVFQIDVTHLELGRTKRVKDIVFPKGVRPLAKQEEVIVLVTKPRTA